MSASLTPFDVALGGAESGNRFLGYHNPSVGTAAGQFGITDPTWFGLAKLHPELGLSADNRFDPNTNLRAQHALLSDNAASMRSYGVPNPNDPSALSLAQFFGPAGASSILSADPNAPLADVLSQAVGRSKAQQMIASNPNVLNGKTVGDVLGWNAQRIGGAVSPPPQAQGQMTAPQMPGVAPYQPIQPTQVPPMPADFGTQTGPVPGAVTVDRTGHQGDPLVALGMGMMSGRTWQEAMGNGGQAYQQAQQAAMQNNRQDAQLANQAAERQFQAPAQAAEVAARRAQAWQALNAPNTITADQAARLNLEGRQQDIQNAHSNALLNFQMNAMKGAPQQFVVPGQDASGDQMWEVSRNAAGAPLYRNLTNGQTADSLPPGAQPISTYNATLHHSNDMETKSLKDEGSMLTTGTNAKQQLMDLQKAQTDANQPGALAGPGIANSIGRTIDQLTGQNIFGDVGQEQIAKMGLGAANWGKLKTATQGTGRLMASEISMLQQYGPTMATDPAARAQVFQALQAPLQRQAAVADAWSNLAPAEQSAIKRSGGLNNWVAQQNNRMFAQQQQAQPQAQAPQQQQTQAAPQVLPRGQVAAAPSAQPGSSANPIDLNQFWK